MENQIEKRAIEAVREATKAFSHDLKAKDFEIASNKFKELVNEGKVKERGNNLLSPSDEKFYNLKGFNVSI